MESSPRTHVAILRCVLALAATAVAAPSLAESSLSPPAGVAPLVIPFSIDRRLPHDLRPTLEEAARKLGDSRCQEILTDFVDASGRRLDVNLAAIGQTVPSYLGFVLFYDGRGTRPCADRNVLAWTTPGSRAVSICWDQFAASQRTNVGFAADIIIHEALHTLGLGENPPDARLIAAQVVARCGR
ncbi:MAG: hypothetical protein ABI968_13940 [Acidobacteriota bacterium]